MKTSLNWLKEYVDVDMEVSAIADALTMAGLEVETVQERHTHLESVVVAKVLEVSSHPNADKLSLCKVETGETILNIVCGAPNVAEGMLVPLALPGTVMPNGMTLKKGKIRGEKSEGMICSAIELEIGEDEGGIMSLNSDLTIGEPLNKALNLYDPVIEIDLTPNRPDCLGIIGIAREVATFENKSLKYPETHLPGGIENINDYTSVSIEDPDLCPRYAACLLTDIKVGPSPFWLKDRLLSVGLKPINNIVDITNFVMMETGQPLHAFDFDNLAENRIVVKRAQNEKTFVTLDEKERSLDPDMLMICDGEKPVALAGVMGGLNSEIEDHTTRVLIESAYFTPASVRKTAKTLGLPSDASHRFERGVDPEGTLTALKRAAELMLEIGGGQLIDGIIDEHPKKIESPEITLSVRETNRLIGTSLSQQEISGHLHSIEFQTTETTEDTLTVIPPPFRVDIEKPVDLMEEIARLTGYNNIPTSFPMIPAKTSDEEGIISARILIKDKMNGLGLTETVNYSFIHEDSCDQLRMAPEDPRRKTVKILNPLTEDQAVMRTTIIPGLLDTARRNISKQVSNLKIFETGKIFLSTGEDSQPDELEMLSGLITGFRKDTNWYSKEEPTDFYDVKGIIEGLFESLHITNAEYKILPNEKCDYTKPGYSAEILIDGTPMGIIGEVHPEVLSNYRLKQPVFIFELNLGTLIPMIPVIRSSKEVPKYPSVNRDITIICDNAIEAGHILGIIEGMNEQLVERTILFDIYDGDPIPEGKRSLSIRVIYRSPSKTLKDKNVTKLHKKITDELLKELGASLPV